MPSIHSTAIIDPAPNWPRCANRCVRGDRRPRHRRRGNAYQVPFDRSRPHGTRTKLPDRPGAYVGLDPQHLKFDPRTETSLMIGDNVIIREGASVHRAFKPGAEHATRIGNGCFVMAASHIAHDCQLGNDVILANNVMLGGHVTIDDRAFIGGGTGIHQFCRVGRLAILAGNEAVSRDIPPFAAVRYGGLKGYNAIGCRAQASRRPRFTPFAAFREIHSHRVISTAIKIIRNSADVSVPEVDEMLRFIASAKRGIQPSVRWLGLMMRGPEDSD